MFLSRKARLERPVENPLIAVVAPFDHRARQALYAATNDGRLKRGTWDGCALNRASAKLGNVIRGQVEAAELFNAPREVVSRFIHTWDTLRGNDARCTELLRDAILALGLFPDTGEESEPDTGSAETVGAS